MATEQDFEEVDNRIFSILSDLIRTIIGREGKDNVSRALLCFLVRETNTWRSIRVLRKNTPEQFHSSFMVDAGTLLRAMFDAFLQAAYIYGDPAKRLELATLYLDFETVERHLFPQKMMRHDTPLADHLKSSSKRADIEKRTQQEYDRIKGRYLKKNSTHTRSKWYEHDMGHLARAAGREAEYDTFVAQFSGCVHSSAFAVNAGPLVPPQHVMALAAVYPARVAAMNVDYNKIDIGDERMILDQACKGWLEKS